MRGVSKLDAGIYAGFALNGNDEGTGIQSDNAVLKVIGECREPIRTRCLGHVTGY